MTGSSGIVSSSSVTYTDSTGKGVYTTLLKEAHQEGTGFYSFFNKNS